IMDDLQRLLGKGEYAPFTSPPILESKFVQVKSHSDETIWYVEDKMACNDYRFFFSLSSIEDECPNPLSSFFLFWFLTFILILSIVSLFFNRLFPLKFVELSVHSTEMHHFMLRLVNGRCYYLELCAPPDKKEQLFHMWLQLLSHLNPPENT
ncbi:Protein FAM71D, partial [Merops nubicus]